MGRPKGKSMKEYSREFLASMTDEERQEFMEGIPKVDIWKMAEGNPENKIDAKIETTSKFTDEELEAAKQFILGTRLNKNTETAGDSGGDETHD